MKVITFYIHILERFPSVEKKNLRGNRMLLQSINPDGYQKLKPNLVKKLDIIQPRLRRSNNKSMIYHFVNNYPLFSQ